MNPKNEILISLLLLIFLSSCTQNINDEVKPVENLIPREEMVDIIVDMQIFDAIVSSQQKKIRKPKVINYNKYFLHNSIMEKYDITREQFEESFTYYQNDLNVIDDIYADVITKLSKMKSETELGE